jgi:hypothetical protein
MLDGNLEVDCASETVNADSEGGGDSKVNGDPEAFSDCPTK